MTTISIGMSTDMLSRIDEKRGQTTRSEFVRELIEAALEEKR